MMEYINNLLILLVIVLSVATIQAADIYASSLISSTQGEPFFPQLFEPGTRGRLHIKSERCDQPGSYLDGEELIDLNIGKATFIETKQGHRTTIHYDANSGLFFQYKPYSCAVVKPANVVDIINKNTSSFADFPLKEADSPQDEHNNMYLMGVSAIWHNAASKPKRYKLVESSYSAMKDVSRRAHKWTVVHQLNSTSNLTLVHHLYFYENAIPRNGNSEMMIDSLTLETIEIEDGQKHSIVATINVLALERDIPEEAYSRELQLPLMYGCDLTGQYDADKLSQLYKSLAAASAKDDPRLRLEITATKFETGEMSSSDTISFELISSTAAAASFSNIFQTDFKMVSQRGSQDDRKILVDLMSNVAWDVDKRLGTCKIKNVASKSEEHTVEFKFANGLEIKTDERLIRSLFTETMGFSPVKLIKNIKTKRNYIYLTKDFYQPFDKKKTIGRIVRKYSFDGDNQLMESARIEKVIIYIMSERPTKRGDILEMYHLSPLQVDADGGQLDYSDGSMSDLERARVLDISEECYLTNDEMKYGLDYAWVQLYYPVESRLNKLIQIYSSQDQLKNAFYAALKTGSKLSYQRIPRMELMFDESGFTLRMLLLDLPPLNLIYQETEGMTLESVQDDENTFDYLAPDIGHCADMCRLHKCDTMSYCSGSFSCVLTREGSNAKSKEQTGCQQYKASFNFKHMDYFEAKLRNILSIWKTHDYSRSRDIQLPTFRELPENRLQQQQYLKRVQDLLIKREELISVSVADFFSGQFVLLVPSSFTMEQDNLAEFDLTHRPDDELEVDPDQLPTFYRGIQGKRYNFRALEDELKDDTLARYYGIDYDQCALACSGGNCNSFSYCKQGKECILTSIYNIKTKEQQFVQINEDCLISQRDFLSKFHRFQNIQEPATAIKQQVASNPHECAHTCVSESKFNCLAFTFCKSIDNPPGTGSECFYAKHRSFESLQLGQQNSLVPIERGARKFACDHYSRSYLADFAHFEHREIDQAALVASQVTTSVVEGNSIDRCAELCAIELMDCSAFQFCYDPGSDGAKQKCTMVEIPASERGQKEMKIELDKSGEATGKLLIKNQHCHVFSLLKESSEAASRQLALTDSPVNKHNSTESKGGDGLSLGASFALFIGLTLVFFSVGFLVIFTRRSLHKTYSRRIERVRYWARPGDSS